MGELVTILARKQAEMLILSGFPANVSVVCFSDSHDSPLDYSAVCDDVFSVQFDDIEYDEIADCGCSYTEIFPEAEPLAKFIRDAVRHNRKIICQCEYGESRSAGCAAAIAAYFAGDGAALRIFADYRYLPNKIVFHKVLEALQATSQTATYP